MGIVDYLSYKFWDSVSKNSRKILKTRKYPENVVEHLNVPYMDDNRWEHTMDVYYPDNRKMSNPVIIDIHGGGWMSGNNVFNKRFCYSLAECGFVVVNINYRLIPTTDIAGQLEDCINAINWVYNHIHYFCGDKNNIFLIGDSAGGFLASYSALITTSDTLASKFHIKKPEAKIRALGLISPVCYMQNMGTLQPYYDNLLKGFTVSGGDVSILNIDKVIDEGKMPPTLMTTSTGDVLAKKHTNKLHMLLKEKKITNQYFCWGLHKGKMLPHVFPIMYPELEASKDIIQYINAFFKSKIQAKTEMSE